MRHVKPCLGLSLSCIACWSAGAKRNWTERCNTTPRISLVLAASIMLPCACLIDMFFTLRATSYFRYALWTVFCVPLSSWLSCEWAAEKSLRTNQVTFRFPYLVPPNRFFSPFGKGMIERYSLKSIYDKIKISVLLSSARVVSKTKQKLVACATYASGTINDKLTAILNNFAANRGLLTPIKHSQHVVAHV